MPKKTATSANRDPETSCQMCAQQMCVVCKEKLVGCQCPSASYGYCNKCYEKRKTSKQKKCITSKTCEPVRVCLPPSERECEPPPRSEDKCVQEETLPRERCAEPTKSHCAQKCPKKKKLAVDPMLLLLMHYLWKKSRRIGGESCCKQCDCSGDTRRKLPEDCNFDTFDDKPQREFTDTRRQPEERNYEAYERPQRDFTEIRRTPQQDFNYEVVDKKPPRGPCCNCPRGIEYEPQAAPRRPAPFCDVCSERHDDDRVYWSKGGLEPISTRNTRARTSLTGSRRQLSKAEEVPPPPSPYTVTPQYVNVVGPQQSTPISPVMSTTGVGTPGIFCTTGVMDQNGTVSPGGMIKTTGSRHGSGSYIKESARQAAPCHCPVIHTCKCEKDEPVVIYKDVVQPRTTCETRDREVQCGESPSRVRIAEAQTETECQTDITFPLKKSVIVMERASNKLGFFPRDSTGAYYKSSTSQHNPSFALAVQESGADLSADPKKRKKSSTRRWSRNKKDSAG